MVQFVERCPAGQEGLEPPTRGFGVRCSAIRATALNITATSLLLSLLGFYLVSTWSLLGLFVAGVLAAAPAELRELELFGVRSLVLRRGVIALPTGLTFQGDDDACCGHGGCSLCHLALGS